MPLYNEVYKALSGNSLITDLTSSRIYPVHLPQATSLPALTYQRAGSERVYSLSGYSTLENPSLQIDCWSSSFEGAKTLAANVKTVMDGASAFAAILVDDTDLYEDEVGIHRVSQDFSIWYRG